MICGQLARRGRPEVTNVDAVVIGNARRANSNCDGCDCTLQAVCERQYQSGHNSVEPPMIGRRGYRKDGEDRVKQHQPTPLTRADRDRGNAYDQLPSDML